MEIEVSSVDEMLAFGAKLGAALRGGEVIELVGDVGAGKTTLTKGIAKGLMIDDEVQSPTFTISRVYEARDDLHLAHYDFYRLVDAGIMSMELHESINDPRVITVIEWAEIVAGVLPKDSLAVTIVSPTETARRIKLVANGSKSQRVLGQLA